MKSMNSVYYGLPSFSCMKEFFPGHGGGGGGEGGRGGNPYMWLTVFADSTLQFFADPVIKPFFLEK